MVQGVQKPNHRRPLSFAGLFRSRGSVVAVAIATATLILSLAAAQRAFADDSVPSQTLRNVAGIVAHRDGHSVPIGTAFFVSVPSRVFEGRSFVYVVTAHHNLLDTAGQPAAGLFLTLEDSRTGVMREEPLPSESRWVLDPVTENSDVAATPLNPTGARIAPISLDSIMVSNRRDE